MAFTRNTNHTENEQTRDTVEYLIGMTPATGTLVLSAIPADGDTLTIYGTVFEFRHNVAMLTTGRVAIPIGATLAATAANISAAISGLGMVSHTYALDVDHYDYALTALVPGTVGNVAITESCSAITDSGMANGTNGTGATITADVSGVEAACTTLDGHIQTLNTTLGGINTDFGTLDTSVDDNTTAVGTNTTALGTLTTATGTTLNTSVGTLNTSVGTLKTSVDSLNTSTGTTLNASVGTLNTSVGTLNTSVGTTLNTSVGTLNTTVGNLTTALATPTETAPHAAAAVVAAGPTAAPLTAANSTFCTFCHITARTGNLANILLGTSTSQIIPIVPGGTYSIQCAQGHKTDLNDWYILGTEAEGVDFIYLGA